MDAYDPAEAPDPAEWLSLDEGERHLLVKTYHRLARIRLPNARLHAAAHVVVENQIALGDELPVRRTVSRLMEEGLDRHEAIHAVASVFTSFLADLLHAPAKGWPHAAYNAAVERLTAEGWRATAVDEQDLP